MSPRKKVSLGDWGGGITVAVMEKRLTPKQAARVKHLALTFHDPEMGYLFENDIGHQWFCFCLDVVARRES